MCGGGKKRNISFFWRKCTVTLAFPVMEFRCRERQAIHSILWLMFQMIFKSCFSEEVKLDKDEEN